MVCLNLGGFGIKRSYRHETCSLLSLLFFKNDLRIYVDFDSKVGHGSVDVLVRLVSTLVILLFPVALFLFFLVPSLVYLFGM